MQIKNNVFILLAVGSVPLIFTIITQFQGGPHIYLNDTFGAIFSYIVSVLGFSLLYYLVNQRLNKGSSSTSAIIYFLAGCVILLAFSGIGGFLADFIFPCPGNGCPNYDGQLPIIPSALLVIGTVLLFGGILGIISIIKNVKKSTMTA